MNDMNTTWETYAASWKAETDADKQACFEQALAPDCVYSDPMTQARGWDELTAYMNQFHSQVPGGHFVTTEFMAHHGRSLAKWEMRDGNDTVLGDGVSYGEYNNDGKLLSMSGFFAVPG